MYVFGFHRSLELVVGGGGGRTFFRELGEGVDDKIKEGKGYSIAKTREHDPTSLNYTPNQPPRQTKR